MLIKTTRNNRGFTIIEIIVVLVLISIIAAATFSRSINTDQMNFISQYDKIQNQARYPQSMAMKRSEWWGFSCDATDYWIFTGTNETIEDNPKQLFPGQQQALISLNDLGVTMGTFTVIFDPFGRPHSVGTPPTLRTDDLVIDLTGSGSQSGSFTIVPETGLIR